MNAQKESEKKLVWTAIVLMLIILGLPDLLMPSCAGDITRDGKVDGLDFAILGTEMGRKDCMTRRCRSDLNNDGKVDAQDKLILQSDVGRKDCLAEAVASPENGSSDHSNASGEEAPQKMPPSAPDKVQSKITSEAQEEVREGVQDALNEETAAVEDSGSTSFKEKTTRQERKRSRFIDHGDGTVTDGDTGLMWTKDADLPAEALYFYNALSYIDEMNKGNLSNFGYTDWRLPSLEELRSLKDYTDYTGDKKYFPAEGNPFENVQWMNFDTYYQWPTYFWATRLSWMVSSYCRLVGSNTITCVGYLWPVRGGRRD
jgi:hypothetical protein